MPFLRSCMLEKSLHKLSWRLFLTLKNKVPKPLAHASVKNECHRSAKGPRVFLRLGSQHVKPDMLYNNYTVFKVIVNSVTAQLQILPMN